MRNKNSSRICGFGTRFLVNCRSHCLRVFILFVSVLISFTSFLELAHADEYSPNVICELPDLDLKFFEVGRYEWQYDPEYIEVSQYEEQTYFDHVNRVNERFVRHKSQDCWFHFTEIMDQDGITSGYHGWSNGSRANLDVGGQRITIYYNFDGEPLIGMIERKSPFCSTSDAAGNVQCTEEVKSWTETNVAIVLLNIPGQRRETYCVLLIDEYTCGERNAGL